MYAILYGCARNRAQLSFVKTKATVWLRLAKDEYEDEDIGTSRAQVPVAFTPKSAQLDVCNTV